MHRGRPIELKEKRTLIGRSFDCDVVCDSRAVSRKHAVITCVNGEYYLEDNKSRNGTKVNNVRLTTRRLLRDYDEIQICDTVMMFVARPHDRAVWERIDAVFAEASNEQVRSIDVLKADFSLEDIVQLRGQLEKCHVRLERVDTLAFQRMLEDPESEARRVLTKGFHRLVILDATKGRDAAGGFNLETFNRYLFGRLSEVFALKSTAESYHDEDVSQCLKDEDRSLFCFLNEQEIPTRDLRRLRGFTQDKHQTLFVCRCARDLVSEEERYEKGDHWEPDSGLYEATLQRRDPLLLGDPLLLELTNHWNNTPDLDLLLRQVVEILLPLFKRADRAFLILVDKVSGEIAVRSRNTRRPEDDAQTGFSATIVKKCLETVAGLTFHRESVAELGLKSVMCAPLCTQEGKAFGALLLDTQNDRTQFTVEDLKPLMGVASQASIALAKWLF
jgi:hypothetical protein